MSLIARWTLMVCSQCGEQAGMNAHGHAPPTEWRWLSVEVVPAEQLRGAVGTLVRIATRDYDPLQHESPGSLAREALAAMGVDPATFGGQ
jgi:hypothetical protein